MVVYRMIMERNYDAQIEDAFRCFDKKGLGTIPRQDFELLFENLGEKEHCWNIDG